MGGKRDETEKEGREREKKMGFSALTDKKGSVPPAGKVRHAGAAPPPSTLHTANLSSRVSTASKSLQVGINQGPSYVTDSSHPTPARKAKTDPKEAAGKSCRDTAGRLLFGCCFACSESSSKPWKSVRNGY